MHCCVLFICVVVKLVTLQVFEEDPLKWNGEVAEEGTEMEGAINAVEPQDDTVTVNVGVEDVVTGVLPQTTINGSSDSSEIQQQEPQSIDEQPLGVELHAEATIVVCSLGWLNILAINTTPAWLVFETPEKILWLKHPFISQSSLFVMLKTMRLLCRLNILAINTIHRASFDYKARRPYCRNA